MHDPGPAQDQVATYVVRAVRRPLRRSTLSDAGLSSTPLGARQGEKFSDPTTPRLGAIMVFWRESKDQGVSHAGFYNGEDITARFSPSDRKQRVPIGIFGLRSYMDPLGSGVDLRQFSWYYRVEDISS